MLKLIKDVSQNEKAVKAIFDHYKNFAVAAVIIAVALKVLQLHETGLTYWVNILSGLCMMLIGGALLLINERHGMHMLKQAGLPIWQHLIILFVYGMTWIILVKQLVVEKIIS